MQRSIAWGLVVLVAGLNGSHAAEKTPNVVLILADDLGYGDVGFDGRTHWTTPNLDRLASQGMIARRFYTAAVVCAPSRGALLTGKSTIHCGVSRNNADLPAEQVTIAESLKARGYDTALFGKWHHGVPKEKGAAYVHPMDQGFDRFFGFTDAVHAWEKFPKELWDGRAMVPVSGHADDLFADHAIAFLEEPRDRPFFLYLPLISAHFHIEAPADEVARHRPTFTQDDPAHPVLATYAAMVTRFDRNVGRVMETLDRLGLADGTIVIVTSDHGATFEKGNQGASVILDSNAPHRGGKRTLWEGGIHVPCVVRWPGHVAAGSTSDEVQHMTDLFPTLMAASGATEMPADLDGRNLLPVWTGVSKLPERTVFWEWRSEGYNQLAAMRGDEKLVVTEGGKPELYDVKADPAERRNLAALRPDRVKQLDAQLRAWLATEARP